jgi:hypothetical protein
MFQGSITKVALQLFMQFSVLADEEREVNNLVGSLEVTVI